MMMFMFMSAAAQLTYSSEHDKLNDISIPSNCSYNTVFRHDNLRAVDFVHVCRTVRLHSACSYSSLGDSADEASNLQLFWI